MTASNSSTVVRRLRSSGDAGVGVMRDPEHDDRMCAVLSVMTTDDGKRFQFQLTLDDVLNVYADLVELLSADQDKASRWWQTLADGSDGRPRAPKRFARAAAHE